jgi:hypothetical protein|tara:strand:- start:177 stop:368 length:192 start_codon:yes stop_codon:yes gene_type:complete
MNAFNYSTQTWLTGEEARTVRIQQIRETIELIDSPQGPNYLYSVNAPWNARQLLNDELASLTS